MAAPLGLALLAAILTCAAPALSQDDLLADLRAEVAAITASAAHSSREARKGDGGNQEPRTKNQACPNTGYRFPMIASRSSGCRGLQTMRRTCSACRVRP